MLKGHLEAFDAVAHVGFDADLAEELLESELSKAACFWRRGAA
jgi:hypothetical protein